VVGNCHKSDVLTTRPASHHKYCKRSCFILAVGIGPPQSAQPGSWPSHALRLAPPAVFVAVMENNKNAICIFEIIYSCDSIDYRLTLFINNGHYYTVLLYI